MSTIYTNSRGPSFWIRTQRNLNRLNHVFIITVTGYMTYLAYSHSFKDTAMHAFLTTVGFHLLMAEALMSHFPINRITRNLSYRNKSRYHGLLQLAGGSIALMGVYGKFNSTSVLLHFTTLHGLFGLAASFMCCASLIGGLVNYFQPKFAHRYYTPSEIRFRHNFFGLVTFTLAMYTIYLGYRTRFFEKYVDAKQMQYLSNLTIVVYILTVYGPFMSLLRKRNYRSRSR